MKKLLLLPLLLFSIAVSTAQTDDAIYTVIFESNWSQDTHPHSSGSLPSGAHWSQFVGVTHNDEVQFVGMGILASPGIESVAETGNTALFFSEVNAAVSAGNAYEQPISGTILDTPLGNLELGDFQVNIDYPLLSAVSMIAPSPDWMIAIDGVSLIDGDGNWILEQTFDVYAYDAGTDSGPDYSSPNMDTDPQEPISSLQGVTPFSNEKIGTVTIMLNELLNVDENSLQRLSISPNPALNYVNIEAPNLQLTNVEVYSAIGQKVISRNYNSVSNATLDVSNLKSGLYMIRLQTADNKSVNRRLIKQ